MLSLTWSLCTPADSVVDKLSKYLLKNYILLKYLFKHNPNIKLKSTIIFYQYTLNYFIYMQIYVKP